MCIYNSKQATLLVYFYPMTAWRVVTVFQDKSDKFCEEHNTCGHEPSYHLPFENSRKDIFDPM